MGANTVIESSPGTVIVTSASVTPNVNSVNTKTGTVVLAASDVGAPSLAQLAIGGTVNGATLVGFQQPQTGSVASTVAKKLYAEVDAYADFGADPTGTVDSTAAFASAFAAGRVVKIPPGTYISGNVAIPANTTILGAGRGLTIITPKSGTSWSSIWYANGNSVEIGEIQFNVSKVTFSSTYVLYANGFQDLYFHDIYMPNAGFVGIYTLNCTDVTVERCKVLNTAVLGIQHDGSTSARTRTLGCYVANSGTTHGIQISGGSDHIVKNCYVTLCPIFGINVFNASFVNVSDNICYNTTHEGINVENGSDVTIANNIVHWDTTTSQDFGISIYGQTGSGGSSFHLIRGNKISNCGKSGIGLAAATTNVAYCTVSGNIISNSNQLNLGATNGGGAGIILYGTAAQKNRIEGNIVFDNINTLQYGVFEWNSGGAPSNNQIACNQIINAALAPTFKAVSSTEALTSPDMLAYTPTISASSGSLTTASAVGYYMEVGKLVFFHIVGTITTNGTGSGQIILTLPFTCGTVSTNVCGRESSVTGNGLSGTVLGSTNQVQVVTYGNAYPGANGAQIQLSGCFVKA